MGAVSLVGCCILGVGLVLGAASSSSATATHVDLGPACEGLLAALPPATSPTTRAAWPHHDPLLDAMVPDTLDGRPSRRLLVTGAEPVDETRLDHQLAVAAGRSPADYRMAQALGSDGIHVVEAIRVDGADPRTTLDALLTVQVFPTFGDGASHVTCDGSSTDGQVALRIGAASGEPQLGPFSDALLMPFRDAWLLAAGAPDWLATAEPVLRDHLVQLAGTDIPATPDVAPTDGTRVAPPASAEDLAARLPGELDGTPISWIGEAPGQLGRGMVPAPVWAAFDPALRAVSDELGVDLASTWGDTGSSVVGPGGSAAASITVLADPAGDGARWIAPYLAVRLDRDTLQPDRQAPRLIPKGTFKRRTVGGREVLAAGSDKAGRIYLYASGPWFFLLRTESAAMGNELLAALP